MVLTTSGAIPSCPRYVAVSYCWGKPEYDASNAMSSSNASVLQPLEIIDESVPGTRHTRPAHAPPHVLRRAVRYAASRKCGLV